MKEDIPYLKTGHEDFRALFYGRAIFISTNISKIVCFRKVVVVRVSKVKFYNMVNLDLEGLIIEYLTVPMLHPQVVIFLHITQQKYLKNYSA